MKRVLFPVVLVIPALLLGACTLSVTPGLVIEAQPIVVTPGRIVYVNDSLRLTAYPGSTIYKIEQSRRKSKVEFASSANLEAVYAHFNQQLIAQGWQRTHLTINRRAERVEAEYRLGSDRLKLTLNREGRSGRYKLELD